MLSKQALEEFRTIYLNQYGKELSCADAMKQANSLMSLYKTILSPLNNETSKKKKANLKMALDL